MTTMWFFKNYTLHLQYMCKVQREYWINEHWRNSSIWSWNGRMYYINSIILHVWSRKLHVLTGSGHVHCCRGCCGRRDRTASRFTFKLHNQRKTKQGATYTQWLHHYRWIYFWIWCIDLSYKENLNMTQHIHTDFIIIDEFTFESGVYILF